MASARKPKPETKREPAKALTSQEKDKLALEHAVELAKQFVSAIVKTVYPDADEEWEDQLYDRFVAWRNARRKKWQEKGQVFPPIYHKTLDGEGRVVERDLDRQYRAFLDTWKTTEAAKEMARVQRERMDRMALAHAVELAKRFVSSIAKEVYPDADSEWEDQLYDRFVRWRDIQRREWPENGQAFPAIYNKDKNGKGRIVEENLGRQYRSFLEEWKATEAAAELERIQRERMALAADVIRTAEAVERKKREMQLEDKEHGDG